MAFLSICPDHREFLQGLGLESAPAFLRLQGVIYCGHPDRNVARVTLGAPGVAAFLKKEHRVRWRDRLANAWAGFGFVSRSEREHALAGILHEADIPGSEVMAAGEHDGQAFLLVRAVDDALDLRSFLREMTDPRQRCRLARQLGTALARIHNAGLSHPDLYSKHILVQAKSGTWKLWFLDWQRAKKRRLTQARCCRELAVLDATLAQHLVPERERLRCLHAYWRGRGKPFQFSRCARAIRRRSDRLAQRSHIRELRQEPLRTGQQNLIWLDGEALCVTKEFREELAGTVPTWMRALRRQTQHSNHVERSHVTLATRAGRLVRRQQSRPWRWLWRWLRRRTLPSRELEQAGDLFRLERYGVTLPRLLAVGQRHERPWRTDSFLLTEFLPTALSVAFWLAEARPRRERLEVIEAAGDALRRVHEAGYRLADDVEPRHLFLVQQSPGVKPKVVLASADGLCRHRKLARKRRLADLRRLRASFGGLCRRTEHLRFVLAYLDLAHSTAGLRELAQSVLPGRRAHLGNRIV